MLKDSPGLDAILQKINSYRVVGSNGEVSYQGSEYYSLTVALRTFIENRNSLPQIVVNSILSNALCDKDISQSLNQVGLKRALYIHSNKYQSVPLKNYQLLTSWSADLSGILPRTMQLGNHHIKIGSVSAKFNQKEFISRVEQIYGVKIPYDYMSLLIKTSARCKHSAFEETSNSADTARGLINIILNEKMVFKETFGGRAKPVNLIQPGPLHTLNSKDDNSTEEDFWFENRYLVPCKSYLQSSQAEDVRQKFHILLKRLRKSKLASHAQKVLISYCRALDNWDLDTAFLELWRSLEVAVNSTSSYDETMRRALFLWKNHDIARAILNHLKERRNLYVHRAAHHPDTEILLFQLKPFVEQVIMVCINNPLNFNDAEEFTDFLQAPSVRRDLNKVIGDTKQRLAVLKKAEKFLA